MTAQNFTLADGTRGTVDRFMQLPKLRQGYWWRDHSPLGSDVTDWREEVAAPVPDDSRIFGYDARAFMARQYK